MRTKFKKEDRKQKETYRACNNTFKLAPLVILSS